MPTGAKGFAFRPFFAPCVSNLNENAALLLLNGILKVYFYHTEMVFNLSTILL